MKTYSEIARHTGISVSHISRVMRGERRPSLTVLLKLSKELGLDVDRMIKRLKMKGVSRW